VWSTWAECRKKPEIDAEIEWDTFKKNSVSLDNDGISIGSQFTFLTDLYAKTHLRNSTWNLVRAFFCMVLLSDSW
jgi:hypothetical protein